MSGTENGEHLTALHIEVDSAHDLKRAVGRTQFRNVNHNLRLHGT